MADRVLVAPPGITRPDQFAERNTQPMPQPMMGPRPSLIVGGPAYFTPEGYQAPVQPAQSFMPTNVAPDPIRDQFNRMNPTPPPPPPQAPTPAPTPAPISDPEAVVEPVVEPVPDIPAGAYPPYIPGVTPFPGIPDLRNIDFSGLPGMGDIDMDRIIQEYQDRIDAGEPEPFDSFLPTQPDPRDIAYASVGGPGGPPPENNFFVDGDGNLTVGDGIIRTMGSGPENSNTVAPEPEFVPPPQEPNGFFPGIDFSDFEDFDFGETTGNPYGPILNRPSRVPFDGQINEAALQARVPRTPQDPAPVYTPPPSRIETPQMGGRPSFDFSNLGNFNLR